MTGSKSDHFADVLRPPAADAYFLSDDGTYPNNNTLPLLVYDQPVRRTGNSLADVFNRLFRARDWGGIWRNGIFSYHHYHSTAHEVLGIAGGTATVQLGGPEGITLDVTAGDVLVLPAGVAHKNQGSGSQFLVVGAYPEGQQWDLKHGEEGERPEADRNIEQVSLPKTDPVYGSEGPVHEHWENA